MQRLQASHILWKSALSSARRLLLDSVHWFTQSEQYTLVCTTLLRACILSSRTCPFSRVVNTCPHSAFAQRHFAHCLHTVVDPSEVGCVVHALCGVTFLHRPHCCTQSEQYTCVLTASLRACILYSRACPFSRVFNTCPHSAFAQRLFAHCPHTVVDPSEVGCVVHALCGPTFLHRPHCCTQSEQFTRVLTSSFRACVWSFRTFLFRAPSTRAHTHRLRNDTSHTTCRRGLGRHWWFPRLP